MLWRFCLHDLWYLSLKFIAIHIYIYWMHECTNISCGCTFWASSNSCLIRMFLIVLLCNEFQIICTVRRHILQGGPTRLPFTIPPLVFTTLKVCLCSAHLSRWIYMRCIDYYEFWRCRSIFRNIRSFLAVVFVASYSVDIGDLNC